MGECFERILVRRNNLFWRKGGFRVNLRDWLLHPSYEWHNPNEGQILKRIAALFCLGHSMQHRFVPSLLFSRGYNGEFLRTI